MKESKKKVAYVTVQGPTKWEEFKNFMTARIDDSRKIKFFKRYFKVSVFLFVLGLALVITSKILLAIL